MRTSAMAVLLLALSACGSGAEDGAGARNEAVAANGAASQSTPAAKVTERRCGWLHNPTPGNWWLIDGEGEWILAVQGGKQVEGMDDIPDMTANDWRTTNGSYGYGCACMMVTSVAGGMEVERIADVQPKPLEQCRADKALPKEE